ncbi:uncharacterized protein LOC112686251 [Sipha flava]|uniref:Uncharacterized protein LOC112686251 n=1 Tax=Sipha flava TaxID=143950 RepID=A0A8B8FUS4_9HEMI|nr:uncharacterized protein LOC112686251 [Sipha flava]
MFMALSTSVVMKGDKNTVVTAANHLSRHSVVTMLKAVLVGIVRDIFNQMATAKAYQCTAFKCFPLKHKFITFIYVFNYFITFVKRFNKSFEYSCRKITNYMCYELGTTLLKI